MVVVLVLLVLIMVVMVVVLMAALVLIVMMMAADRADVLLFLPGSLGLGQQLLGQRVQLHGGEDLVAGNLAPVGGDDDRLPVLGPEQVHRLLQLVLLHVAGAAEDDGAGVLHLVVKELAEVLHIHLALFGVDHRDGAAQLEVGVLRHPAHRLGHVGQLAHAGGLDDDAVGRVGLQHLLQGHAEVAHQRAADAAGVHLGDLNAGVLHKAAVNADLAELVLNQHQLLALEGLPDQLFDQRGLARAQEAGNNINGCHNSYPSIQKIRIVFYFIPFFQKCKGKIEQVFPLKAHSFPQKPKWRNKSGHTGPPPPLLNAQWPAGRPAGRCM